MHTILTDEVKEDFRNNHASAGVQDAIDGLLGERIAWGHGDKYYNRQYSSMKRLKEHKGLQAAYKELGIDASNLSKVANECRVYESASLNFSLYLSSAFCNFSFILFYPFQNFNECFIAVWQVLLHIFQFRATINFCAHDVSPHFRCRFINPAFIEILKGVK